MTNETEWEPARPVWARQLRPGQVGALEEITDAYDRGVDLVVLSAPTGAGKSLIGEFTAQTLRHTVGGKALYVCTDKGLQDQFQRDFEHPTLKGRANYRAISRSDWTAEDCGGKLCSGCPVWNDCPYQVAKRVALQAPIAVLNTAYWLTEVNGPGAFSGRDFVIVDEADTLEDTVLGWAEIRVGWRLAGEVGVRLPAKGAHHDTLYRWLGSFVRAVQDRERLYDRQSKEYRTLKYKRFAVARVLRTWDTIQWVRMYEGKNPSLVLKPVRIGPLGQQYIWQHGSRFLLMSATMIGAEQMLEDLGWDRDWEYVEVDSDFPPENRQVYPVGAANMTWKNMEEGTVLVDAARALDAVMDKHPDDRILVHTGSYKVASALMAQVTTQRRRLVSYEGPSERERALRLYRHGDHNAVLLAPSMARGVDLPDEMCRVQVICKVPFLSLKDPQVSARLHGVGGQAWYEIHAARQIVQMTGRGVRHRDDHAVTYVLDAQFGRRLQEWRKWLPKWWLAGLNQWTRPSDVLK